MRRKKVVTLPLQIGIRLTPKDLQKLEAMCASQECGRSEVMRSLLRAAPGLATPQPHAPQRPGDSHG